MNTLYYLPLEPYKERYTSQLSAPRVGWYERNWIKHSIPYIRVEPSFNIGRDYSLDRYITTGVVLDAVGRSRWALSQIDHLLSYVHDHKPIRPLCDSDVILFDDFWHPGIEALPYVFSQVGIRPRMFAYLWAQSVDQFDFTHSMRGWMRHFEKGIGRSLDGIFVASSDLKDLVVQAGITTPQQVHVVGLPFCSDEVLERMPGYHQSMTAPDRIWKEQREDPQLKCGAYSRLNQVVWSSRWDTEKNPSFFLQVAAKVLSYKETANTKFVICTSAKKLRSNDEQLLLELRNFQSRYPDNIEVRQNLTKEKYYSILCESKVQFNSALQDWVSFTLLEASVAGCVPLYPYFRSFPETLDHHPDFLYRHKDVEDAAARMIGFLLDEDHDWWSVEKIKERSWIHKRYDDTWIRMLAKMGIGVADVGEFFHDVYSADAKAFYSR